jgi:hypothetical protein
MDANTPHSFIHTMMQRDICVICGEPLEWKLGQITTPHLHHDHLTGQIYGFAHAKCNPGAEAKEIFRLTAEIEKLQQENQKLKEAQGILLEAA